MKGRLLLLKENSMFYANVKYGIIGLAVGAVMSLVIAVSSRNGISISDALINMLYSTSITLSIANVVMQYQCRFNPTNISFWKFIIGYYLCNLVGMVIGMELGNLIRSVSMGSEINFFQLKYYETASVLVLIVGTLILFYHLQKINAEALLQAKEMEVIKLNQSKTEAELQALQSKINPHFLYNALNSIVSLIHEDPDKAEDMTLKLSKLFRYSINSMQENFCMIKEEIDILNTYLAIEKVRFGNRINFTIDAPVTLENKLVPRFILQPLVENALKHGLKDVSANGEIKVEIRQVEQQIQLFVYDNGIPFPEELEAGYGMQSTFDKLQLLYKDDYDLQINNSPKKHIKISIPLT
jgi:two-component system LytT family sensor kinase